MILLLSAFITALSFLPTVPALNCLLAWCGTILLIKAATKEHSLTKWFIFGLILTATQFYWAPYIFHKYSESNYIYSFLFALTIWGIASIQFLILGVCLRYTNNKALALVLIWPALEIFFPKLIPWHLGNTQLYFTYFIQIADIAGPALISTAMLWISYLILNLKGNKLSLLIITLGLIFAYSHFRIKENEVLSVSATKISVGAVQPNFNIETDFSFEKLASRMQKLMLLSGLVLNEKIDLLIWPENAVGYTYRNNQTIIERNSQVDPFPALHLPLLFGAQTEGENLAMYNSAYIMQTDGNLSSRYNKQVLFPFSETIPLSNVFPFLKKLFKPAANVMDTERQTAMRLNDIELATVICFEDLWTSIYSNLLKTDSAQILITLANDGWFANSTAAYQHKMLASWRAIEYRRYMLRVTNNGYTELISPTGKVISAIEPKTERAIFISELPALKTRTIYHYLVDKLGF